MQVISLTNEQALTLVDMLNSIFKTRILLDFERNTIYKVLEQVGRPNHPTLPTPLRYMGVPLILRPVGMRKAVFQSLDEATAYISMFVFLRVKLKGVYVSREVYDLAKTIIPAHRQGQ